jgi:hypothetical protein
VTPKALSSLFGVTVEVEKEDDYPNWVAFDGIPEGFTAKCFGFYDEELEIITEEKNNGVAGTDK